MKNKKANVLTENVVFVIFTILFIAILFAFVARASSGVVRIEEAQAKKIALIIDGAEPGTNIVLNVQDVLKKKRNIDNNKVFSVVGNRILVKLDSNSGYVYSFFNEVDVKFDLFEKPEGWFLSIIINEKEDDENVSE